MLQNVTKKKLKIMKSLSISMTQMEKKKGSNAPPSFGFWLWSCLPLRLIILLTLNVHHVFHHLGSVYLGPHPHAAR